MEEEYIDIAHSQRRYECAVASFQKDSRISDRNKELVRTFLRDAALGKTIIDKAKKKIGHAALAGYVPFLTRLILFVKQDLDKLTDEDMEAFIEALETDVLRSRSRRVVGQTVGESGAPYSPRYKVDMKVTIRKFYKWLWGKNRFYPKIVEWLDTYIKDKEVSALTETEVARLVDRGKTTLQRALIQVFFDGGFRIGELLNVRLHHVRMRSFGNENPPRKCFCVRVPFSKTLRRTVPLPMRATTKWLTMWLEDHPAKPVIQSDGTLDAKDVTMQLFPMADSGARHMISRAGRAALGKRVYPHLLRHTSATYWCNRLSYFQFCKRFGWTMTSKMPQKYIDREGVEELAVAEKYVEDERAKLVKENLRLHEELDAVKVQQGEERPSIKDRTGGLASHGEDEATLTA